jgi:hypothetical protein
LDELVQGSRAVCQETSHGQSNHGLAHVRGYRCGSEHSLHLRTGDELLSTNKLVQEEGSSHDCTTIYELACDIKMSWELGSRAAGLASTNADERNGTCLWSKEITRNSPRGFGQWALDFDDQCIPGKGIALLLLQCDISAAYC